MRRVSRPSTAGRARVAEDGDIVDYERFEVGEKVNYYRRDIDDDYNEKSASWEPGILIKIDVEDAELPWGVSSTVFNFDPEYDADDQLRDAGVDWGWYPNKDVRKYCPEMIVIEEDPEWA